MSVNSQLFEKHLTCKLTVLLALSSALRASSMQHLNINFMAKWQKPSLVISSISISFMRVREKVKHHQQSLTRNIPKMKAFVL